MLSAAVLCVLVTLTGCAGTAGGSGTTVSAQDRTGPTVIGADGSAESRVVAALYGELLTAAGQQVRTAPADYTSPAATVRAVLSGEISLAPAYEDSLLSTLPGGAAVPGDTAATLSMALPVGFTALPPAAADVTGADPAAVPSGHVFPLIAAPYAGGAARKALAGVNSALTTEQLADLAAAVRSGRAPAETARTWLRSHGLLD